MCFSPCVHVCVWTSREWERICDTIHPQMNKMRKDLLGVKSIFLLAVIHGSRIQDVLHILAKEM